MQPCLGHCPMVKHLSATDLHLINTWFVQIWLVLHFSVRSRDVLMNAQCPHKWWLTLKSVVFCSNLDSSLPPLIGAGGGLVCESVGKADLLSAHFDGKQSRDPVDLPSTCHPSPSLTTIAFRSREVKRLLLDLNSYGGTDPLGMFPLFLKKTAVVLAPHVAVVFRQLLRLVAFLSAGEWLISP